jgi:hypothetical protein
MRELVRMKEHQAQGTGSGRLRAAIFGINDGLVTNASLIIGVAAAAPDRKVVTWRASLASWLGPSAWPLASS